MYSSVGSVSDEEPGVNTTSSAPYFRSSRERGDERDARATIASASAPRLWEEMEADLERDQQMLEIEDEKLELQIRLDTAMRETEGLKRQLDEIIETEALIIQQGKEGRAGGLARINYLGTHAGVVGIVTSILSGLINGLVMFSFCVAFASLMFNKKLEQYITVGVEIQCSTVLVGIFAKLTSRMPFSIFGPDIIPALFLASAADNIARVIDEPSELMPTLLVAFVLSSFLLALTCILLAYFNGHRIVDYLPISVLKGFLACIGYEVMKAAWKTSAGEHYEDFDKWHMWKLVLPAYPMGVTMYFFKRYHIGNPVVAMAFFLVGPLVLFFSVLAISGLSVDEARNSGWFYEKAKYSLFERQWEMLNLAKVDTRGLGAAMPDVLVMVVICSMDILLKLQSTKKKKSDSRLITITS
mmetsp:Transcript_5814/g.14113  ORF Transcript_5814/g.14113 Transcript_5814/m.14113 type:complete len:413 (-) Transcript_5814:681-1919(-)